MKIKCSFKEKLRWSCLKQEQLRYEHEKAGDRIVQVTGFVIFYSVFSEEDSFLFSRMKSSTSC